jgi:4-amino-4-deoxy-L-arabinose transferase-like glycosyltransferase
MRRHQDWLIAALLFMLALLPRAFDLNLYWTLDEDTILNRSYFFLEALNKGDWKGTFMQDATPAVTTSWGGALGIVAYYRPQLGPQGLTVAGKPLAAVYGPSDGLLVAARWPTVVFTSLLVVAVYFAIKSSLGRGPAVLAGIFLAFDPFYVSFSRLLGNDAPHATFAILAAVFFSLAWQRHTRRWFLVCGACCGLAVLSKAQALMLVPLILIISLVLYALQPREARNWRQLAVSVGLCYGAMALTVFVIWPSMWVQPLQTIGQEINAARTRIINPHPTGNFFWGQAVADPSWLFYPVTVFLRSTPWVLIGAATTLVSLAAWLRNRSRSCIPPRIVWILCFWAIASAYVVTLSLAAEKSDRLILPSFLALDVLGAIGWGSILDAVAARWRPSRAQTMASLGVAVLALAQVALCLPNHPYYLSYFNPVLGGAPAATHLTLLGWGEGLEQAGRYLAAKPGAATLRVGVRWPETFRHYFSGTLSSFPPRQTPQRYWPVALDYAVVYVSDLQRFGLPRTFRELYPIPERVVTINGVDYVSVYNIAQGRLRSLPPEATPLEVRYRSGTRLLGYKAYPVAWDEDEQRNVLPLTMYWQVPQSCARDHRLLFRLVNSAGTEWAARDFDPPCVDWQDAWPSNVILPDEIDLPLLPGTPPGAYDIVLRVPEGQMESPADTTSLQFGPVETTRQTTLPTAALDITHAVNARLGDQALLLGYNLEGEKQPGQKLQLTLFWQSQAALTDRYKVFVHVVDRQGKLLTQIDSEPVDSFYATTLWQPGEIVRDPYTLTLPDDPSVTEASILVGWYRPDSGERVPVTLADGAKPPNQAIPLF